MIAEASRLERPSKTNFAEARDRIGDDDKGKWDVAVRRESLVLRDGSLTYPLDEDESEWERLTLTSWATTQMCQRLGIPTQYFKRCPAVLQDVQANYWLKCPDDNGKGDNGHEQESDSTSPVWLLRAKHNRLRGVLSEKYSRLDNAALFDAVEPLVQTRFKVKWFELSDESMHLRLVDPALTREVLPDDRLMVGVHVANSEVGKRCVTVDSMVYRLVCSNGLVRLVKGKSLLHQRHIHVTEAKFEQALERAIGDALTTGAGFIERLSLATREPIGDMEGAIDSLSVLWNLSQPTRELVKLAVLGERPAQQETLYGLVNGFTNAAQRLPLDDRYHLEVMAGKLLEQGYQFTALPPRSRRESVPVSGREPITHGPLTMNGAAPVAVNGYR